MMSQLIDNPSPVPSPVGFVVKNGWNNLSRMSSDAGAVVADADFDRLAEVARRHLQHWAKLWRGAVALALGGGVETVRNM
jgi:hypothetical protein